MLGHKELRGVLTLPFQEVSKKVGEEAYNVEETEGTSFKEEKISEQVNEKYAARLHEIEK